MRRLSEASAGVRDSASPSALACAGAEAGAGQEAALRASQVPGHVPVLCEEVESIRQRQGRRVQGDRGDSALQDAHGAVTHTLSQR